MDGEKDILHFLVWDYEGIWAYFFAASFVAHAKLYIPSTINIWKKVLTKAIWADKKWAGFWQISLYIK